VYDEKKLGPDRGKKISLYIGMIHAATSWVGVGRGTKAGKKRPQPIENTQTSTGFF
jgi:hypothetical protein